MTTPGYTAGVFARAKNRAAPRQQPWHVACCCLIAVMMAAWLAGCGPGASQSPDKPQPSVPSGVVPLTDPLPVPDAALPGEALLAAFARGAGDGVSVHGVDFEGAPALVLIVVDLSLLQPQLLGTDGAQRVGVTGREALTDHGAELVVGSSFVSELNSTSPVGLLKIDGETLSELQRHGYTRVLGIRDDHLGVVSIHAYHRGLFDSAMQVGPGVIEGGLLDISDRDLKRPRYHRTFVATCGPGTAVIGASLVPMNLYTVGRRFLETAAELGMDCDEVVNLAGDREVVLAMASADGESLVYLGHPGTTKAGLVAFRRR